MKETNKSDFSRSRIGDRVWSPFGPECEVGGTNAKVKTILNTGIEVVCDNLVPTWLFYTDGMLHWFDSSPTLFHCRPAIDIPPPPKRTKKVKVEVQPYGENGVVAGLIVDPTRPPVLSTSIGPLQSIEVEVYDD